MVAVSSKMLSFWTTLACRREICGWVLCALVTLVIIFMRCHTAISIRVSEDGPDAKPLELFTFT